MSPIFPRAPGRGGAFKKFRIHLYYNIGSHTHVNVKFQREARFGPIRRKIKPPPDFGGEPR